MAVELRCPECQAKLRLPVAPEPDSEIECPKCQYVFSCEENLVHAGAAEADKPKKKKAEADKPKPTDETDKKADKASTEAPKPFKRKRRRAKKRKTKPIVIVAIVVGALMVIGSVAGVLIWFFTKKSASQEMMTYLPDDCDEVIGINVGHLQKYPEFYKSCENMFAGRGFKAAADSLGWALGDETLDYLEYVVQGTGVSNGTPVEATVLRTKKEFDTSVLSKFPGAKEYSNDGVRYYTINPISGLEYTNPRVFAPNNRLVVFCPGTIPEAKFRAMLNGNKDNLENTAFIRSGQLGKQVIRGTAWKFMLYPPLGKVQRLSPTAAQDTQGEQAAVGAGGDEELIRREISDILASAQGCGVKASVGSRDVRGEFVVLYKDSDAAANMLKKWKEKEWVKDEESEPPRWWKTLANKSGGGKTAPNVVRDGLAFRSSGPTFTIRTKMSTTLLQSGMITMVGLFNER